ncbi:hypothetical protein KKG48_04210 [Patescibacteria group bacterium]|nr:hypothetical protein [Patescibacteria group bacterium]
MVTSKAKARQVVTVKDGKLEVTDQAAASLQKVKALPTWLTQGPDAAGAYVEQELNGLSKEAKAALKELAGAVAALRDRVASLG